MKRDEKGLVEGIDYTYNSDGSVNWKQMINKKFLVINVERTEETDISKCEDNDLIIKLGGLREVARLRGFSSVKHNVVSASVDYVAMSCSINWIPNFEMDYPVEFQAMASATIKNCQGFSSSYLPEIAQNRSFSRAVRNFLGIEVVSEEELKNSIVEAGDAVSEVTPPTPSKILQNLIESNKKDFKYLKRILVKENQIDGVKEFKAYDDIPVAEIYGLITRIKKKLKIVG